MIVAKDNEWVLYTPPKTGSTSLHRALVQEPICASSVLGQHSAVTIHGAVAFATTRHPVTRALSLWKHLVYQYRNGNKLFGFEEEPSFNEYTSYLLSNKYDNFFGWNVSRWLVNVKVDYFLKLECFHIDLSKFFHISNMEVYNDIGFITCDDISDKSLEIIREWGREDLELCGYEFDDYKDNM